MQDNEGTNAEKAIVSRIENNGKASKNKGR
jgi:hypothetical protein